MAQFIQIGNRAINLEHITEVTFAPSTGEVIICYGPAMGETPEQVCINLKGDGAQRFLDWWNTKAPVTKL